MGLFDLINNIVQITPESLVIPEMKLIWERDKNKNKETAYQELSYIYFLCDYKSPYQNIPDESREKEVIRDFIRNDKWKPDKIILDAILKYNYLQETPSLRLLRAARQGQEKLTAFFIKENANNIKYTSNLEKIGRIIESIDKLEEKVKKDTKANEKIRGGGDIKSRER